MFVRYSCSARSASLRPMIHSRSSPHIDSDAPARPPAAGAHIHTLLCLLRAPGQRRFCGWCAVVRSARRSVPRPTAMGPHVLAAVRGACVHAVLRSGSPCAENDLRRAVASAKPKPLACSRRCLRACAAQRALLERGLAVPTPVEVSACISAHVAGRTFEHQRCGARGVGSGRWQCVRCKCGARLPTGLQADPAASGAALGRGGSGRLLHSLKFAAECARTLAGEPARLYGHCLPLPLPAPSRATDSALRCGWLCGAGRSQPLGAFARSLLWQALQWAGRQRGAHVEMQQLTKVT